MESAIHTTMGGKVKLFMRPKSPFWQCSSFLVGKKHRTSTKTDSLAQAKDFAEDWYLGLRGKFREGTLSGEKNFRQAAKRFMEEYEVLTEGERNERWVQDHYRRIRLHLNPFFGDTSRICVLSTVSRNKSPARNIASSPTLSKHKSCQC